MNVHDERARGLSRGQASLIHLAVGACPACSVYAPGGRGQTVIYNRRPVCVVMRCEAWRLQWSMTWVMINQSMKRQLSGDALMFLSILLLLVNVGAGLAGMFIGTAIFWPLR
jgi:hypothetical protein